MTATERFAIARIIRFDGPNRIFDEEGANAALLEARTAGKLRDIGFTGHKAAQIHLHIASLFYERFDIVTTPSSLPKASGEASLTDLGRLR